jgi:transposase
VTPTQPLNSLTNPNAAGIDIGSTNIHVCVPADRDTEFVKIFATFTSDLLQLRDWLLKCQIQTVAMEATGVYWIPLYEILDEAGLEVFLVNPRQMKQDKKTDILDCQMIQQFHSYGLLKASFRPADRICILRSIIRHRANLIRLRSVHIQHMQKSLHQMNLQLDNVISDITGETGMLIIREILRGNRNPEELAKFRNARCKSTEEEIKKSLEGNYRVEHLFTLKQSLGFYDYFTESIRECDQELESLYTQMAVTLPEKTMPQTFKKARRDRNTPRYDLQRLLFQFYGVDFTQINGISSLTAQIILAEVGPDLSLFPTVKHFTRWLRLSPDNRITGGKIVSAHSHQFKNKLALALRVAAASLASSRSPLGDYYRKMRFRYGSLKANAICAHKLARIIYFMLKNKSQFDDMLLRRQTQKDKEYAVKNLMLKARRLGFVLTPLTS